MKKTIMAKSGHTLFIKSIKRTDLPANVLRGTVDLNKFYVVKNWDDNGPVMLYLGKGHANAPNEIVAWYRHTGSMWAGFGENIQRAIDGACRDGWMYA